MMTGTGRTILKERGMDAVRKFLQAEAARFRRAPILLVESRAQEGHQRRHQRSESVENAVRQVRFLLTQQLGFRTVVVRTSPSPFPTLADVGAAQELARRVGAATAVGVGSGAAIDLAKAVAVAADAAATPTIEELVLIPATYGATLAAASPASLVVDAAEEAIVPFPSSSGKAQNNAGAVRTTIAAMDTQMIDPNGLEETRLSCIAFALDTIIRRHRRPNDGTATGGNYDAEGLLRDLVSGYASTSYNQQHDRIVSVALETGANYLSYGMDDRNRSISLALAVSLLPTVFPQESLLSIAASLAPSLCRMAFPKQQEGAAFEDLSSLLSSAPKIVTTEAWETISSQIESNQIEWNCLDEHPEVLRDALRDHILV